MSLSLFFSVFLPIDAILYLKKSNDVKRRTHLPSQTSILLYLLVSSVYCSRRGPMTDSYAKCSLKRGGDYRPRQRCLILQSSFLYPLRKSFDVMIFFSR